MAREMSRKQFLEALERNGFSQPIVGWVSDKSGQTPGVHYGLVFDWKTAKILRRISLAYVIKKRAEELKQRHEKAETVR